MGIFTGKPKKPLQTVDQIVAPLKKTIEDLNNTIKIRQTKVTENDEAIAQLCLENASHVEEMKHAERISNKLDELLS